MQRSPENRPLTIGQLLDWASGQLKRVSDTPRLDARLLFCHQSSMSVAEIMAHSSQQVGSALVCRYKNLINERMRGMPVAYLTGIKEFWSLEFSVNRYTLIPRPETELLVESALELSDPDCSLRILDLGTGCGAIALAVAFERPKAALVAADNSSRALTVARQNAQKHGLNNVSFVFSDWFENLDEGNFDLILSNPPYIRRGDAHLVDGDIKHEPVHALVAGEDGLDDLKKIIRHAGECLSQDGWLMVEHGHDQHHQVSQIFRRCGFLDIKTKNDLFGNPRVTIGRHS